MLSCDQTKEWKAGLVELLRTPYMFSYRLLSYVKKSSNVLLSEKGLAEVYVVGYKTHKQLIVCLNWHTKYSVTGTDIEREDLLFNKVLENIIGAMLRAVTSKLLEPMSLG